METAAMLNSKIPRGPSISLFVQRRKAFPVAFGNKWQ